MRELVAIEFQDTSFFTPDQGDDVAGIGISHYWGPVDQIVRVNASNIDRYFPRTAASKSYLKAYTALKYGVASLEVLRVQGTSEYLYFDPSEEPVQTYLGQSADIVERTGDFLLMSKYPGFHPDIYNALKDGKSIQVKITFSEEGTDVEGKSIAIETYAGDDLIERIEGSPFPQHETDGVQDFITNLMITQSEMWLFEIDETAAVSTFNEVDGLTDVDITTTPLNISFAAFSEDSVTESDFETAYNQVFTSTDRSQATLLLAPYSSNNLNNLVIGIAEARSNCLALVGFPTSELFTKDAMETFIATLTQSKFGITVFGRAIETIEGKRIIHDGVGPAAGRYSITRRDQGPNQIPSATTFGVYPAPLVSTLSFTEVLDLHDSFSVNSIYTAAAGPQMFGIRTLHPRKNSYFALSNVMRIVALLIQSTLVLSDTVIHTPNNPSKRASVELDRQSFLDNLIGQENLRPESLAQCDGENNTDSATEGGKWLIIDFDLWFYKLIERVKIRIKASDTTTQVNLS